MDKQRKQQAFDTTVRLFSQDTVMDGELTFMTRVQHLDTIISSIDEMREVLGKIRDYCRANSVPQDFKVRISDMSPISKNATTRAGGQPLKAKTPKKETEVMQRGDMKQRILKVINQAKKPLSVPEIAERTGASDTYVQKVMSVESIRRRKTTAVDGYSHKVKYVYGGRA